MEFCALASGSSGNCIYVGHGDTHILVDAGISGKKIDQGLRDIGVEPESISAILITHDHSDHTMGAVIFARKYDIDIYGTSATLDYMNSSARCGRPVERLHPVRPDHSFCIGDIRVTPYRVSHDALDPVAYTLEAEGCKLGMATDLGVYDDYTIEHLTGSDALYLESNHDLNMLMVGSYPYPLKKRIASEYGHLSNDSAAELVLKLQCEHLRYIVLAHVSKDNNFEELAYETTRAALAQGWSYERLPYLCVAHRYDHTELFRL